MKLKKLSEKKWRRTKIMTPQEQAKKIEEIYNEAIKKLEELDKERKSIIINYIKELEDKKIDAIRASILKNKE